MKVYEEVDKNPFKDLRFSHAFDDSPIGMILNSMHYTVKFAGIVPLLDLHINRNIFEAEKLFDQRARDSDLKSDIYAEACIYTHMLEHGAGGLANETPSLSETFREKIKTYKENFERTHGQNALAIIKEIDKLFPAVPA